MDLSWGFEEYQLTPLNTGHESDVLALCQKAEDYFLLSDGQEPTLDSANRILTDLPPGKTPTDKILLGIYFAEDLIGLLDVVKDYPQKGIWIIGLLLIAPAYRSKGLGKCIHDRICNWASTEGAERFQIGVLEDNENAMRFWERLGYHETKKSRQTFVDKEHIVHTLQLDL